MSVYDEQREQVERLMEFLQGEVPERWNIEHMPKLSADQAWSVVYYLQEGPRLLCDAVERCDVCGMVYNTDQEGCCLDFGDPPYHVCDGCDYSDEVAAKLKKNNCCAGCWQPECIC